MRVSEVSAPYVERLVDRLFVLHALSAIALAAAILTTMSCAKQPGTSSTGWPIDKSIIPPDSTEIPYDRGTSDPRAYSVAFESDENWSDLIDYFDDKLREKGFRRNEQLPVELVAIYYESKNEFVIVISKIEAVMLEPGFYHVNVIRRK